MSAVLWRDQVDESCRYLWAMSHTYIHTSLVHSLANNNICSSGNMEGLNALITAIKEMPNLSSLKCASSVVRPYAPGLIGCVTVGHVTHILIAGVFCCSLDENALCGVSKIGDSTYTIEGISALCEGIKQSNIQSLR